MNTTSIDLLELIERDTTLKKVATTGGGEWAGPCPFCGGRDRFRVQPHRVTGGRWYCRGCGAERWHDAITYVQRRDGCDFRTAVQRLGLTFGQPAPRGHRAAAPARQKLRAAGPETTYAPPSAAWQATAGAFATACEAQLWRPAGAAARAYLQRRGLTERTLRRYHIGFHAAGDAYAARGLTIPHWDHQGQLWGIKIRTNGVRQPKYRSVKGSRTALFGLAQTRGHAGLVFCEGEWDVLSLAQELGDLVDCVSLAGAAKQLPLGHPHSAVVLRYRWGRVIFDNDAAGQRGAARLTGAQARFAVERLPAAYGDVNAALQAGFDLRAWGQSWMMAVAWADLTDAQLETRLEQWTVALAAAPEVARQQQQQYEAGLAEWARRQGGPRCYSD